jgi:hypothetical protein
MKLSSSLSPSYGQHGYLSNVKRISSSQVALIIPSSKRYKRNYEAPFKVKLKVHKSALIISIFYSCESWLTNNLTFAASLKEALGVKQQTPNDLALIESSLIPFKDFIHKHHFNLCHG